MGRLIDADYLIERIKVHNELIGESNEAYHLAHEHIIELVEMQPTAYDPDAVVGQLEELPIHDCEGHWGEYIDKDNVIEIVKRGGVHDGRTKKGVL